MDLDFNQDDIDFRNEVRDFIKVSYTQEMKDELARSKNGSASKELHVKWQKSLYEKGWIAPNWPEEHGGPGFTTTQKYIFETEMAHAGTPRTIPFGLSMVAPVLMEFGTEEQKKKYLPDILSTKVWWCQGYSEPGSGSDLASLQCKAEDKGDHYLVNGTKIWTTLAQHADMIFCLVRTSKTEKPQEGISFLLIDMKSPGIEVRPIRQITGGANFNEVYFTDVKIPDSQRLGEVGDGWKVALTTLMNERLAVGDASGVDFQEIFELTKESDFNGENAISNGGVRERLADWYCEYAGLKYTKMRNISALSRGDTPGPDASITKIVSANKLQDIANFGMDLMDNASIIKSDDKDDIRALFQGSLLGAPLIRIAGGTDEILRNIIAEQVLGMPQDVRVDKTVPFNEIPSGSKN